MKKLHSSIARDGFPGASWGLPGPPRGISGPQATDTAYQEGSNWSSALDFSTKALWEKAGLRRSLQML